MKIIYTRMDSGVLAGGIFFAPGVPTEVPDELGKRLIKQPHFKVHREKKRERTKTESKPKMEEEKKTWQDI